MTWLSLPYSSVMSHWGSICFWLWGCLILIKKKKKTDETVQEEKLAIFIFTRQRKCTYMLPVPSGRDIRINSTWSEIQHPFLLWKCLVGFVRGGGISPLTCVCLRVQQGNTVQTPNLFIHPSIHPSLSPCQLAPSGDHTEIELKGLLPKKKKIHLRITTDCLYYQIHKHMSSGRPIWPLS